MSASKGTLGGSPAGGAAADAVAPAVDESSELRGQIETLTAKLEEAHKMASLGRLVAGVVHEINTPLGSIFSNNEVIRRSLDFFKRHVEGCAGLESVATQRALETLETLSSLAAVDKIACERIQAVIRSLKTFARVDEGDLRKADIHEILRAMLKLCSCEFRRRITVETEFAELPEIECHPGLLNQVFLNLFVNACQAIDGEGKIVVRTEREDGQVHVSVSDTGRGIKVEDRPKIFGSGFTTKAPGVGTGLGLKIAHEIVVDHHNGTIGFESEPARGTTFHVRLPIEQPRKN